MARRLGDVLDLLLGEPAARAPAAPRVFAVPLGPGEALRRRAVTELARALGPAGPVLRPTARGGAWPGPRVLLFVSPDPGERQEARAAIAQLGSGARVELVVDGVRSFAEAGAVAWELGAGREGVRLLGALPEERRILGALLFDRPGVSSEWTAGIAARLADLD